MIARGARARSTVQQRGLRSFIDRVCAGCHAGPLLGGGSFQKFGLLRDYRLETGSTKVDEGRFLNSREPSDRYVFRVPMLRNITRTAPYFHDGSVQGLGAAVRIMARVQLGVEVTAAETADLVAFLAALVGDDPANYRPRQAYCCSARRIRFSISMIAKNATPSPTISIPSNRGTGRVPRMGCSSGR
jgi:cytochrome c peroxidase